MGCGVRLAPITQSIITRMPKISDALIRMAVAPSDDNAFSLWLEQNDTRAFLKSHVWQEELVIYAGFANTFMHAVLVPAALVNPPDVDDLMSWNFNTHGSWGVCYDFGEPPSVYIAPPLDHTGSATLNKGEKLVFSRFFEGRLGDSSYMEILQKFVHVSDLHYLEERGAFCRLDRHGDVENVVTIEKLSEVGGLHGGSIVRIRRDVLDEYMALTDSIAILMFDFTRFRRKQFGGWGPEPPKGFEKDEESSLYYRFVQHKGYASYMRGFQIVRPSITKEAIGRRLLDGGESESQSYASYIAYDWKNDVVKEVSCAPDQLSNYFTQSSLPYEVSPAFFRSEVLAKYKADSDKYQLTDRSITCRGAWGLQTFDINEEGQVHTYLKYLQALPYEEQLYWKAYNEPPKGPISKRAYTTDFEGNWDQNYDPLVSLKGLLQELHSSRVPWWTLRSEDLPEKVHYPMTMSPDEWANEILRLDQFVVEGFEEKWLRRQATELGRKPGSTVRSLKLLEECLITLGFEEGQSQNIVAPLRELHNLRSKVKGHASGNEARSIRKKVLVDHGTYRQHFRTLCARCDESLRTVVRAFQVKPEDGGDEASCL